MFYEVLRKLNKYAKSSVLPALLFFLLSILYVDKLPELKNIDEALKQDIIQTKIEEKIQPFEVTSNDHTYKIFPRYNYEMYALIVSLYDVDYTNGNFHEEWKDYLNVKDISTIWGENLKNEDYLKATYTHGEYTGYVKYPTDSRFQVNYFTNSHLLVEDPYIKNKILKSRIGDQIYLKGYLVDYLFENKSGRTTSTSREDGGDGACEIIWVTDYEILESSYPIWRPIQKISMVVFFLSVAYLVMFFFFEPHDPSISNISLEIEKEIEKLED